MLAYLTGNMNLLPKKAIKKLNAVRVVYPGASS